MACSLLFEEIQKMLQNIFHRTLGFKPRRDTIHIIRVMYYPEGSNKLNWVSFRIKDINYLIDWDRSIISIYYDDCMLDNTHIIFDGRY